MRRNKTALAAAITAAFIAPVAFAQVDTSDWNCEYCPFETGYQAEYDVGVSNVDGEDGYRFGNGTGYDEDGVYAELGFNGSHVGESTRSSWKLEDLGLDSRLIELSIGRPGTYEISLGYDAIPYRLFDSTSTVYSGSGGIQSAPDTWTPAATTGGFADLNDSLVPIEIGTDREYLDFGLTYLPTQNVEVYADYRRLERDGIRIAAGSDFTQSAYVPRFIDDYTDTVDAGVRFSAGNLSLSLALYGSFYQNRVNSLTWERLFTPIPGSNQGRAATEPDNNYQQFLLSGVYRADWLSTVLAFSAATGEGEQTAGLLPYTVNASLASPALPVSALDGKVDTSNYAFTLTSKPLKKARVKLSYRFDERDNQTPLSTWTRVITDAFVTNDSEQNIPYSFERGRLSASGSYRLFDTVTISGGYDQVDVERDFQEVADQTDEISWGKLRWRPTPWLEATFKGGDAYREVEDADYDLTIAQSFGQNPLMRKYNLAHRYREFAEVGLSASLPERPLSVGMTYFWTDDSYSKSEIGMTESEERRFTVDFSWAVSDTSTLYLTGGNETIDATQLGSEDFGGPVWEASHDDDFTHFGGGIRLADLGEKFDVVLDYSHSEGETEILYAGTGVSAGTLPELESELDSLRLTLTYNASERLKTDLVLRWETFETADWALDGVGVDTIPNVLTMGATSYDYDLLIVGVSFRYLTGAD